MNKAGQGMKGYGDSDEVERLRRDVQLLENLV